MMEVLFLGTGAAEGWPGVFCQCRSCEEARGLGGKNIRTRTSVQIDGKYKFDLPPDTYHHVLTHKLNLADIRHLFITHCHEDHFYWQELAMRGQPFAHMGHQEVLHVYGDRWVKETADWQELTDAGISFHEVEPGGSYQAGEARLFPLKANHMENRGALIYVFQKDEISLLYGHDSGFFYEEVWTQLSRFRLDLAVLECTHGDEDVWDNHMGIPAVLKTRERMLETGIASEETIFVATHFSHNGGLLHHELEERLNPHDILVAYDGMRLRVPRGS
jgi:phosphoribosyl 1,2-cyclic phosphate phosphodiesterase